MKTKYKYIHFEELKKIDSKDKSAWDIKTNKYDDHLGYVEWYSRWRQYCFQAHSQAIFSQDCLADIIDFIKQLEKL